mmetsp:Transcript_5896/g.9177  ORF Transcript_5896/g.9177 Transcript_5896/m.9177 type:complete len:163 (+) Transcript_5896:449-937(+)
MKNVFVSASILAMGYLCNAGELDIYAGGITTITATKGSSTSSTWDPQERTDAVTIKGDVVSILGGGLNSVNVQLAGDSHTVKILAGGIASIDLCGLGANTTIQDMAGGPGKVSVPQGATYTVSAPPDSTPLTKVDCGSSSGATSSIASLCLVSTAAVLLHSN